MSKLSLPIILIVLFVSLTKSSCIKQKFDAPPDKRGVDPKLTVTLSIAELKELPQNRALLSDDIISGVVVMNDKSGNYFKKIVLQDLTGGIEIAIDQSYLYNDYPVGRKLYVKIKGLYLSKLGGNLFLGYTPNPAAEVSPIPFTIIDNFIVKASFPTSYKVDTLTINQLKDLEFAEQYLNTIIAIKDVEFANRAAGVPFAQIASLASATNLQIEDCSGNKIAMRNSAYAKFQPYLTPTGKGTLTALYTKYNTTAQLIIRDTSDVSFYSERCAGSPLTGPYTTLFEDDFSDGALYKAVSWTGGYNIQEEGTVFYYYTGTVNRYAKISAYVTGQLDVRSWLITPEIDLSGIVLPKLQLKTAFSTLDNASLKAYVSTNFNGNNLVYADWVELPGIFNSEQDIWIFEAQEVALDNWIGQKIRIGFKYVGGYMGTATFGLDDIKVIANFP